MERAVTITMPPGAITGSTAVHRRRRPSPDIALLGLYEISKILSGPARLDQTLGNVVNVLTSFLDMRWDDRHPRSGGRAGNHRDCRVGERSQGQADRVLPHAALDRIAPTATPVVAEDVAQYRVRWRR